MYYMTFFIIFESIYFYQLFFPPASNEVKISPAIQIIFFITITSFILPFLAPYGREIHTDLVNILKK